MRAKFINEGRYWNGTSKYKAVYDELWNELVPGSGEADTLQGELLRMIVRIMYDYYNNGFGNDRKEEATFLENHKNLFREYMKDPRQWEDFYYLYEERNFGDDDELWREAQRTANRANQSGGWGGDYEEEEDADDYFENIDTFIKRKNWDVEEQLDDTLDGIIRYIQLTQDKLIPLPK